MVVAKSCANYHLRKINIRESQLVYKQRLFFSYYYIIYYFQLKRFYLKDDCGLRALNDCTNM